MAETISGTDSGNAGAGIPGAPDPAWVEGAPLRLLAYALLSMPGRTGKVGEIKDALQSLVEPSVKWSHWWQQTQEMVKKSDHFKIGSRPTTITLLTEEIDDIPSPQLPPPPLPKAQREWLQWFQGEIDDIPSKSGNPVKAAHDALNICPPKFLGTALQCTIRAARNFLSGEPTKSAAESWADLLSNAEQRWRSRPNAKVDDDAGTVARVAELMADLAVVPESPKEREWWQWFQGKGDADAVPTSGNPIQAAYDALNVCPPKSLGTALQRTIRAAGRLSRDNPTESAAKDWAHLLSNAALRWRSRPDADNDAKTAAKVAGLIVKLVPNDESLGEAGHWLCRAGALLDERSETWRWRQSFAAVLWDALPISGHDVRDWFRKAFGGMMLENQVAVAREIAMSAFAGGALPVPPARFAGLDALLSYLNDADKAAFLRNLVVLGVAGKAHWQSVVDYIAHAHSAAHPQKYLDAAALAAILLADGRGPLAERAGQGIADALDDDSGAGAPSWDVLLSESRRRIAGQRAVLTDQIEELRAARERERLGYENRIAQSDRETARLRAEIAAGREESRLDIRQDMLTVISETLYDLRGRRDSPEELLRLVETRLSLALRAGGGEEFGTIGETAPYDPIQHQADGEIRPGAPVRIAAPGAVVRGKLTGDRVLVKASVVSLAETEEESCR